MKRLHIDIIGPLPRSKRGNKYILTVQCSFTKWAEAYPLTNQKAKTFAQAIVNNWVMRYGVPDSIHADQGRNFESRLFQEMCDLLQIKKTRTTAYHPSGNGQVENLNKTVKSLLRSRIEEDPETWDKHLAGCMMAYRSSIHASNGYTLYSLMFGRESRLPLDVMIGELPPSSATYGEYVTNLKTQQTSAFRDTREHLTTAQRRQKEYFDKHTKESLYQPGDQVFLYNPQLKPGEAAKFHRNWKGPYIVVEQVTEVTYRVRKVGDPRKRKKVAHHDNLKLYQRKKNTDPGVEDSPAIDDFEHDIENVEHDQWTEIPERSNCGSCVEKQNVEDQPAQPPNNLASQHEITLVPEECVTEVATPQPSLQQTIPNVEEPAEMCFEETRPRGIRKAPDRYGDWVVNLLSPTDQTELVQQDAYC